MVTESALADERVRVARLVSWFFTLLACFFLFFNFLFILTLFQMSGRLNVLSQLFVFTQGSKNLVIQDAMDKDVAALNLLNEVLIRNYVHLRHSIIADEIELRRRWGGNGPLARLSSPYIYGRFLGGKKIEEKIAPYMDSRVKPAEIDIREVTHTKDGKNWTVEFDVLTPFAAENPTFIASLRIGNYPSRVSYSPILYNPLGMTVMEYTFFPKKAAE